MFGLATTVLDWSEVNLPALAVLLANAEDRVIAFFSSNAPQVDPTGLGQWLKDVKIAPAFLPHLDRLTRQLGNSAIGASVARRRAAEHLRLVLSNEAQSRKFLRQTLAPGASPDDVLPREALRLRVARFFREPPDGKIGLVMGGEGNGKSWLVASTWLSLGDPPLTAILPADSISATDTSDEVERILVDALIRATRFDDTERERKRWQRTLSRWREVPAPSPRLVLIVDGINQRPDTDWPRLLDALCDTLSSYGGRLLVSSRDGFFDSRIATRLFSPRDRVDVPEWSDAERNALLRQHDVRPDQIHGDVLATLRNPRVLSVALRLLTTDQIEGLEELTVSRLLFEHMRSLEADSAVPAPADEFAGKLRRHASAVLTRISEQQKDELLVFDGGLDYTSSGRFFRPLPGEYGRYVLDEQGLDLALGLALVHQARVAERNGRDVSERLFELLQPIAALDRTAGAVVAAVTLACLDATCSEDICSALISSFLDLQNAEEHWFEPIAALTRPRVEAFMKVAERQVCSEGRQSRSEWLTAVLRRARANPEVWRRMQSMLSGWLRIYTRAPSGKRARGGQSPTETRIALDDERRELDGKWEALCDGERAIFASMVRKDEIDRASLAELAFSLIAGKPLAPLASDLVAWRLGTALRPGIHEPYGLFAHLLRLNLCDWVLARETLLKACEPLRGSCSSVGRWALQGVLGATGDSADAEEAEAIRAELLPTSVQSGPSYLERLCDSDPCDPQSLLPSNFAPAREAFAALDVTCRVPDEYILHNRSALLIGREVLVGLLSDLSTPRTA